jgi:hypothetical protein
MRQKYEPWRDLAMSRATWYRLGKPTTPRQKGASNAAIARLLNVSVRTVQRDARRQQLADRTSKE